jgi:hypothetical protein
MWENKVIVKVFPVHGMKAYRGRKVIEIGRAHV